MQYAIISNFNVQVLYLLCNMKFGRENMIRTRQYCNLSVTCMVPIKNMLAMVLIGNKAFLFTYSNENDVFYCQLLILYIFTLPNLSCYQCFLYNLFYMYKCIIYHIHKAKNIFGLG